MPRLHHVKRARVARPEHGIAIGDSYYWWATRLGRIGRKFYSKTRPRPSRLIQSPFRKTLQELREQVEDDIEGFDKDDIAAALTQLGEECQDSLSNMPEGLQEGDTGQLLEERADSCETAAGEIENMEERESREDNSDYSDDDAWSVYCQEHADEVLEYINDAEG